MQQKQHSSISKQNIQILKHGQIIQLQHSVNNLYLMSCKEQLTSGSKQQMVGCTPLFQDKACQWVVEIINPIIYKEGLAQTLVHHKHVGEELWFGDIITLKNLQTGAYLTLNPQQKSQSNKMPEVSAKINQGPPECEQHFFITPCEDPRQFNPKINNGADVRIICAGNQHSLQSSDAFFKQQTISEFKETFGNFDDSENADWILYIHPDSDGFESSEQDTSISETSKTREISNHDLVIIRNSSLGAALHSHTQHYYKGSKNQEVTCFKIPRDDNDLWQLIIHKKDEMNDEKGNSQMSSFLLPRSYFSLLHIRTNKILTHVKDMTNQCHSKGLEVSCADKQLIPDEWQIIALHCKDKKALTCYEPFYIKHTPTGEYLAATKNQSYPTKSQMETFLMSKPNFSAVWVIETMKSK